MAVQQKTRDAILAGAKVVVSEVGSYESNMVDISNRAQVSRATVYNHFADKEEMMLTLLESEINRLTALANSAPTPKDALYLLSTSISADPALRRMVETDPQDIAKFVTKPFSTGPGTNEKAAHPLWAVVDANAIAVFGAQNASLILRWLIAQIAAPLTVAESTQQAAQIALALIK